MTSGFNERIPRGNPVGPNRKNRAGGIVFCVIENREEVAAFERHDRRDQVGGIASRPGIPRMSFDRRDRSRFGCLAENRVECLGLGRV